MSDATNRPPASAADPRDLKIAEQARTIAELTARVAELEEKLAIRSDSRHSLCCSSVSRCSHVS